MKAKIDVVITEDDNKPFFATSVGYDGLSRMDVVTLEKILLETMEKLHGVGVEKAKGKDKPKAATI
jgi:hypothetical protein